MKAQRVRLWSGRLLLAVLFGICLWFAVTASTTMVFLRAGLGLVFFLGIAIGWERRYSFISPSLMEERYSLRDRWK